MGKVRMRNVRDGKVYTFDAGPQNSVLRKAIESGDWQQELSGPQHVAKFVGDMMPPAAGMLGAAVGATGGAVGGAPAMGVGAIPGGVVGGFAGGATGGVLGQMGKEAMYGLAGIEKDNRPLQVAGRLAYEGATGGLGGAMGGLAQPARPDMAQSLMRSSIRTTAPPDVENTMLQRGLTMTRAGLAKAAKGLNSLRQEKLSFLTDMEQTGAKWSWRGLEQTLRREVNNLRSADAIGTADEAAFANALKTLRAKYGRVLAPRHAATVADPMEVGGVNLGRRAVLREPQQITPSLMERIRLFADGKVRGYEKMRVGQNVETPSPDEQAYRLIADRARAFINNMAHPASGRTMQQINDEISALTRARTTILKTLSAPGVGGRDVFSAGTGAALTASGPLMAGHIPQAAGAAIPGALLGYATANPALRSMAALSMNAPSVGRGLLAQTPAQLAGLYGNMMGYGDPTAHKGAFGTARPDGSQ